MLYSQKYFIHSLTPVTKGVVWKFWNVMAIEDRNLLTQGSNSFVLYRLGFLKFPEDTLRFGFELSLMTKMATKTRHDVDYLFWSRCASWNIQNTIWTCCQGQKSPEALINLSSFYVDWRVNRLESTVMLAAWGCNYPQRRLKVNANTGVLTFSYGQSELVCC